MTSSTVRPARASDVEAIVAMLRAIHNDHIAWDAARWTTRTPPHASYAEWLGELMSVHGLALVAEHSGSVAGYLIAEVEPESARHWSPEAVYVHDLFVAEPHRGQGLARALMDALLRWRAEHHPHLQLRLMTAAPNEAARRFFERYGFRACVVEMIRP